MDIPERTAWIQTLSSPERAACNGLLARHQPDTTEEEWDTWYQDTKNLISPEQMLNYRQMMKFFEPPPGRLMPAHSTPVAPARQASVQTRPAQHHTRERSPERSPTRNDGQHHVRPYLAPSGSSPMSRAPPAGDLRNFLYQPISNAVATPEQIDRICDHWAALGVPRERSFLAAVDLARHCADVGSSRLTSLMGYALDLNIPRERLAAAIKVHCTLRQFCMYFAKFVWNQMRETKVPPANWQALEYPEDGKFAAFDFFTGVTHTAALDPAEGVLFPPNAVEINAASTHKFVATKRAEMQGSSYLSTAAEVTKGRLRHEERLMLTPP